MDTKESATFRYDTVKVKNGLKSSDLVLLRAFRAVKLTEQIVADFNFQGFPFFYTLSDLKSFHFRGFVFHRVLVIRYNNYPFHNEYISLIGLELTTLNVPDRCSNHDNYAFT